MMQVARDDAGSSSESALAQAHAEEDQFGVVAYLAVDFDFQNEVSYSVVGSKDANSAEFVWCIDVVRHHLGIGGVMAPKRKGGAA
ncbi:hypothetical protein [Paraeggerthella sp.]|uniref:hypothetical protein n=1 Tax=Paraeggerthella sp. TaxID=2897350 RepID=UPI003AB6A82D